MAERRDESITEWRDINLASLSTMDKLELVTEVFDTLSALELREMRDLAEQKRKGTRP